MPYRSQRPRSLHQKKRMRRPRRRSARPFVGSRSKYAANSRLIKYTPTFESMMPFPPRYQTKFTCEALLSLANVLYTDAAFFVKGNSINLPHNIAHSGTGTITFVGPKTAATLEPTGFGSLLSATGTPGPYTTFRVYASSIEVDYRSQATVDSMNVCVIPTAATANPATLLEAMSQPYARNGYFSGSCPPSGDAIRAGKLVNYISTSKFFGTTSRAVQDDVSGTFEGLVGIDPLNQFVWKVFISSADGAANNQAATVRVKTTYYVELFEQVLAKLPQV